MLIWDETDLITCLEVEPEKETDGIWHKYTISKDGMILEIIIYQYDREIYFDLKREGIDSIVFKMKLIGCNGVRYLNEATGESLEFAPSKCFGTRYDGESAIPYGVRVTVNPSIQISIF